jgi:TonB-linked SusC/RagA family outer membrane protein
MKKIKLFFTAMMILLVSGIASAQNITVTGVVTDSKDEPVPAATVMVKGTKTGTATANNGTYSIVVPANGTLVFTCIGYADQEIPVNGKKTISVKLADDTQALEGTIVVGYGSAQKVGNIVGSVSTVSSKSLTEKPSANVGDALQGKIAGLQVFNTSGEPQSTVSIQLHGASSINLSTTPLFIVDGVQVSGTILNTISPQDIENISVLKDASSTAIYGSRAANGVIYITTKKGSLGEKPTVSVSAQYGVSMLTAYNFDMMSAEELYRFEELCQPNVKNDVAYQAKKAFVLGNGINFNWTDYLFDKSAPLYQVDASVRGATNKTNYYLSFGYYSEQGTSKANSNTKRFNLRSNINTQVTNWLQVGTNLALAYSKYKTIVTGWYTQAPILCAVTEMPYNAPYKYNVNADGTVSYGDSYLVYPWDNQIDLNTYYKYNTNDRQKAELIGQSYFLIQPIKGLKIRSQEAIDAFDYTNNSVNMPSYTPNTYRGRASEAFQRYYQLSSTNTIEYTTAFNNKHFFTALLGHESILQHYKYFNATGTGLTDDRLVAFSTTTSVSDHEGYSEESAFNSFFFNTNYNYDDRYFVDASVRTDGSSLFGKNNRYATFYAVGGMWKAKHEQFLQNVGWVNDLNVNLTYGTTGNSGMSSWYASLGLVGAGAKYNNVSGWGLSQVPNADLTWETVSTTTARLSGRLFNRVSFDFQAYDKVSTNLLMEIPYSATTGRTSGWGNIAKMSNKGLDLSADVDVIHTKDFLWNVSANVNYNKNELNALYNGLQRLPNENEGYCWTVGHSLTEIYMPLFAGVDSQDGSPMWYDRNGNTTKKYTDDLYQLWKNHDTISPWSGGFSTNFSWKNWGLNADFSWIGSHYILVNEYYYTRNPQNQLFSSNFEKRMLNIWTHPGQVTNIPKYGTTFNFDSSSYSNAAFVRMKNITLSYVVPAKILEKTKVVSGLRLYFTGRNLLTFTNFEGYDPEVVGLGNLTKGLYPNSRQYVFGAEIKF